MSVEQRGPAFDDATQDAVGAQSPQHHAVQGGEWGVGAVSARLGVSAATLRTWDRRYGIGPSQRTDGGHRRYSEDDISRVRVMARFTSRGVPAQSAARVALSNLGQRPPLDTGRTGHVEEVLLDAELHRSLAGIGGHPPTLLVQENLRSPNGGADTGVLARISQHTDRVEVLKGLRAARDELDRAIAYLEGP